MAIPLSDSITERYQMYDADPALLDPQIRGLEDKVNDALSDPLRDVLKTRLEYLKSRRQKVKDAKAAQEEADRRAAILEADGFPPLAPMEIPAELLAELDKEDADNAAASSGFVSEAPPQASVIQVTLGAPVDK